MLECPPMANEAKKGRDKEREKERENYTRSDFFRDLKKVVRKLPPDHPSRSDSRKR